MAKENLKEDLISLGDLAILLKVNKSSLNYYCNNGLLVAEFQVGRMKVFNKEKTLKIAKKIIELKEKGKRLNEIKTLI